MLISHYMCTVIIGFAHEKFKAFPFVQAKDDDLRGDEECARRKGRIALVLNLFSVVLTIVFYAIVIGVVVKQVTSCRAYYGQAYYC